jgi:hypothetical protein
MKGKIMPHYMFQARYTSDAIKAMIDNPQNREDDETMAAASLIIGGSGAFSGGATTKLMTAPQAMSAMQKAQAGRASYKPATG